MQIPFKRKRLRAQLILGLIWVGFGIVSLVADDRKSWTDYGYMAIGLLYLSHFTSDRLWKYLSIENGILRKNWVFGFGPSVELKEVVWIKKFAGDYTLKAKTRDLKIDTDLIDGESLEVLNQVLGALDLPADKTPFQRTA